jgi:uncharacterized protein YdhG (YjbR/CyaY superfamily)
MSIVTRPEGRHERRRSVQRYLNALNQPSREALSDLRDHVVARYPDVTGHIRYRMPLFKLDGRPFVGFQATKRHLALYVWSDQVIAELDDLLADHATGESTIRFSCEHPLPACVVDAVLDRRAAEILDDFPYLEREDIAAALQYAAEAVRKRQLPFVADG